MACCDKNIEITRRKSDPCVYTIYNKILIYKNLFYTIVGVFFVVGWFLGVHLFFRFRERERKGEKNNLCGLLQWGWRGGRDIWCVEIATKLYGTRIVYVGTKKKITFTKKQKKKKVFYRFDIRDIDCGLSIDWKFYMAKRTYMYVMKEVSFSQFQCWKYKVELNSIKSHARVELISTIIRSKVRRVYISNR